MRKPLFLFAFANDKSESLRLQEEENIVKDIFRPLKMQDKILFESIRGATLDRIYRNFHDYHNRIAIFHYSGHSDERFLHLTDTGARSENLSKLIGMQKNLKLVFLNGCANEAQVKDLHANGVKVVIATNAKIKDEAALRFSEGFYQAFVAGNNIRDSFDVGQGYAKDKVPGTLLNFRSAGWEEDVPISDSEWVLLASDDTHLNWSIEDLQEPRKDQNISDKVDLRKHESERNFRKEMVELAFEGIRQYNKINEAYWEEYKKPSENPNPSHFNNLQKALVNSYPYFLSKQFAELFTGEAEEEGRRRLLELNEVYLTLMKYLLFISLADMWKTMLDQKTFEVDPSFKIRNEYKKDLQNFFQKTINENPNHDFGWLIGTIGKIFRDNNKTPFIEEMNSIFNSFINFDEFYEADRFLEVELKRKLAGELIPKNEVVDLCEESGKKIGILLKHCGFLCSYQLVVVKDIEVVKPNRVAKAKFYHNRSVLSGDNEKMHMKGKAERSMYTTNNSILLTKNFAESDETLNLSPFIIDENVLKVEKDNKPKIFFFKRRGKGDNPDLHFELAEDDKTKDFKISKEMKEYRKDDIENIRDQMEILVKNLGLETNA